MATNEPVDEDMSARSDRLELLMSSAGELLVRASQVAERTALDIEALAPATSRNAVDSRALTAASERHDRLLDYLLEREAGAVEPE